MKGFYISGFLRHESELLSIYQQCVHSFMHNFIHRISG